MSKQSRLNYLHAISHNVEHKKMYKAKKQWVVAGMSFLVAVGLSAVGLTTHADTTNTSAKNQSSIQINKNGNPVGSKQGVQSKANHLASDLINSATNNKTHVNVQRSNNVSSSNVSSSNVLNKNKQLSNSTNNSLNNDNSNNVSNGKSVNMRKNPVNKQTNHSLKLEAISKPKRELGTFQQFSDIVEYTFNGTPVQTHNVQLDVTGETLAQANFNIVNNLPSGYKFAFGADTNSDDDKYKCYPNGAAMTIPVYPASNDNTGGGSSTGGGSQPQPYIPPASTNNNNNNTPAPAPSAPSVSLHVEYKDKLNSDILNSDTVTGSSGSSFYFDDVPAGYKLASDSFNQGTYSTGEPMDYYVYIVPNSASDHITFNGDSAANTTVSGSDNATSTISAPTGYHYINDDNGDITFNGQSYTFNVAPNTQTDAITFNGDSAANTTVSGSDNSTSNVPAPSGYHYTNGDNGNITFNGQPYTFNVAVNTQTDTIKFNGDSDANTTKTGNSDTSDSVQAPAGYHFTNGSTGQFKYDGNTYTFDVTPNMVTDQIDYVYNNNTVGSTTQSGTPNTSAAINATNIPSGYSLASNDATSLFFAGNSVSLSVNPIQKTDLINYVAGGDNVTSMDNFNVNSDMREYASDVVNDINHNGSDSLIDTAHNNRPKGDLEKFNHAVSDLDDPNYKNSDLIDANNVNRIFNDPSNKTTIHQFLWAQNGVTQSDQTKGLIQLAKDIQAGDGTTIGSTNITGNEISDAQPIGNNPQGLSDVYSVNNPNQLIKFDGSTYTIPVTRNDQQTTFNINYQVNNNTISKQSFTLDMAPSRIKDLTKELQIPVGYKIISVNGQPATDKTTINAEMHKDTTSESGMDIGLQKMTSDSDIAQAISDVTSLTSQVNSMSSTASNSSAISAVKSDLSTASSELSTYSAQASSNSSSASSDASLANSALSSLDSDINTLTNSTSSETPSSASSSASNQSNSKQSNSASNTVESSTPTVSDATAPTNQTNNSASASDNNMSNIVNSASDALNSLSNSGLVNLTGNTATNYSDNDSTKHHKKHSSDDYYDDFYKNDGDSDNYSDVTPTYHSHKHHSYSHAHGRVSRTRRSFSWILFSHNKRYYKHVTRVGHGKKSGTIHKGHVARLMAAYKVHSKHRSYLRYEIKVRGHRYFISTSGVHNAYLPKSHRYVGKHIRILHTVAEYAHVNHGHKGYLHKGKVAKIRRIKKLGRHNMTRIELTNGRWITANRKYIKVI